MKNIFFALAIVLAAIGACNPPQSTTNPSSDTTGTNTNRDTTTRMQTDTSGGTQRDTSMNR
ncbi:hypothetical protein [Longitalea luteola]|uniref:hypothetical protein n=1 Tax=Longitalea luteola TaxID=2812563 RepID=UPI001A977DF4|nr:hypothetical protein [Longitalea luteola]